MSGTTEACLNARISMLRCLFAIFCWASSPAALAQAASRTEAHSPNVATTVNGFGVYEYDGSGNIVRAGEDEFFYDKLGRIRRATVVGIEQTFTYDRHGNIINIATLGESGGDIAVGADNKLSGATYDGSGNLRSYHGGTFTYDGLNVVTESTPAGGNRHLYIYTASNERLATIEILPSSQQKSEWTLRDPDARVLRRLARDTNGTWSWKEDYIYRGPQLLAAEVPSPEKIRHFHLDPLGTPRLLTGNGGSRLAERAYGAFGRGFPVSSSDLHETLEFTGHERDNFQLDYMHARYYDPMLGRFLSVDPIRESADLGKAQSWNRYSYVLNNPVNLTDPDGRTPAVAWWLLRTFGPPIARSIAREAVVTGTQITRTAMSEYAAQRLSNFEHVRPIVVPPALSQGNAPSVAWPGWDSTAPPEGFSDWRGKRGAAPGTNAVGAWVNPETGEYLSPDLDHADPKGHWTYGDEEGNKWDVYPDGTVVPAGTDRASGEGKCDDTVRIDGQ